MDVLGNRGKCAQPCRLPYDLYEDNHKINSGYLLSTRDLCALEYIPAFIQSGVKCLKIEGRMKSPEYVATVTRIYRKYIDLALSNKEYIIEPNDQKDLLQAFNRGMSSSGHLDTEPNKNLVFKEKPNNMGLPLGKVQNYNKLKGLITVKLKEPVELGDTISLENKKGTYTISELMKDGKNVTETKKGQTVTIGRMKGNIKLKDNIYKMSSKKLSNLAKESYRHEHRKIFLNGKITIQKNKPISFEVTSFKPNQLYKDLQIKYTIDTVAVEAKNKPLTKEIVEQQLRKTSDTPYEFKKIDIDLGDNLFLPRLSTLNELRRNVLKQVEEYAIAKCHRNFDISKSENDSKSKNSADLKNTTSYKYAIKHSTLENMRNNVKNNIKLTKSHNPKISVLLNKLNTDFNYESLDLADNVYIPLKYFTNKKYDATLKNLSKLSDLYIYMPTIVKGNYKNLFYANAKSSVEKYDIKGFVISNICNIKLLNGLFKDLDKYFKLVTNYTFNVFNSDTVLELKKLGISTFTISPELDKKTIQRLCEYSYLNKELIIYGRTPLVNMNYCLLGETDKCYPECKARCTTSHRYYLKDRLNMEFPIMPDNIQTVTTLFNSKVTSLAPNSFNVDSVRIDILDESNEEISEILQTVRAKKRFEGKDYTNGNLNREI